MIDCYRIRIACLVAVVFVPVVVPAFLRPETIEIIERTISPRGAIEMTSSLLAEYMPDIPQRDKIVQGRVSIENLSLQDGGRALYYFYAGAPLRIVSCMKSGGTRVTRLFLLNLVNKLIGSFSTVDSVGASETDRRAVALSLHECLSMIISLERKLPRILVDGVGILLEIDYLVRKNKWSDDGDSLQAIPRITSNILEYVTLSSYIQETREPFDALGIVYNLFRLAATPTSADSLRRVIRVVDEGVEILRTGVELALVEDPLHRFLINDIVTALSGIH